MDKQKNFEKVVKDHLGLSDDVDIHGIAVTIKRKEVIHIPGLNYVDVVVNIPDKIKDTLMPGIERKKRKKRTYKKNPKSKDEPTIKSKRGRKVQARPELIVTDDNVKYAKDKLKVWGWNKKFEGREPDLWDNIKGKAVEDMEHKDEENMINFYNRVVKRMMGE